MSASRLEPPIPITTPKGEMMAFLLTDRGIDFSFEWTGFIVETGECRTFKNEEIRTVENITYGRIYGN